jgi:hypothetical protein
VVPGKVWPRLIGVGFGWGLLLAGPGQAEIRPKHFLGANTSPEAMPEAIEMVPAADSLVEMEPEVRPPLRPVTACPEDLETLTALLVRDIPGYANRVLQRSLGEVRREPGRPALTRYRPAYILLAGRPELAPLAITDRVYTTEITAGESLKQVFFTTLERQYTRTSVAEIQHFHWLFLAPAETGWYLAFMFSTIDDLASPSPPLPPQESTHGSVGQAVQLWLRDCRAGAITPIELER